VLPIAVLLIAVLLTVPSIGRAESRPNVLLIMVDDLRDHGGAFTREAVKTPNLDRLRARGLTFERAYVQYPVCNPSRSSLMTGLRAEQTGIVDNATRLRDVLPDVVTLPQLCRQAGWQTHAFGKLFHLGGGRNPELRQLWMDVPRSWDSAQSYEPTSAGREFVEGRNVTDGALRWCHWGAAAGTDDDQPDGQIAAAVVEQIRELGDQRWFIGCGFMKPHDPFVAPKAFYDLYPPESLKPWRERPGVAAVRKESVGFGPFGEAFSRFSDQEFSELFRAYCACTTFMDAQLGRVLDVLDERELWESTLVIFVGDHGYHTGERGWWNKNTLFERACRAPLIIAGPGITGGQTSRALVEFVDLYPTVADYCGLELPHQVAGVSLRPVLADPAARVKDFAFTLVTRGDDLSAQSVRSAQWRLTRWSDGQVELYDHDVDPEEFVSVAAEHPEVVRELSAALERLPRPVR
jgi:uncharacterized sulfatase